MRVFFNVIVIQIIFNLYVFRRGWQVLPNKKTLRIPFATLFAIELTIYLVGFIMYQHLPTDVLHNIAWMGTSWSILILYLTCFLLLYDIFRFISRKKGLNITYQLENIKTRLAYYCIAVLITVAAMVYGNYCFHNPKVVKRTLEIGKYSPHVNELRIAVVSDIHVGFLINKRILSMYVDRIMEQAPDMILLVGDIIDYDLKSVQDQNMWEEFHRLKAPYGVFACTGNHEYIDVDSTKFAKIDWLRDKSGLTLLRDTAVFIHNSFYVIGRDNDKYKSRKNLSEIMKDVDKKYPMIVINHEPHRHNLREEVDNGADIALYGHTHNGQLFPANLLVQMMYEVGYGYKKKGDTHIYVSSGLGLAGPQYRIGTISEIVLLDVKFNK